MVDTASYQGHILIKGLGLDDVLEPDRSIVIVDDFYADYYGDYIFLGYNVYAAVPVAGRGDALGLFEAAILLDRGPSVLVCGDEPTQCLYVLASHMALHGREPREALEEAERLVSRLYGRGAPRSPAADYAVKALYRLGRILGPDRFAAAVGAGDAYNYGWGRLHYAETLSWLAAIEASDEALAAASVHYLVEGPGEPGKLLDLRVEALGREALGEILGPLAGAALGALRGYAEGRLEGAAAELALVEALRPGGEGALYLERRGETLLVHCPAGEEGEPSRGCVEAAGAAAGLLEKLGSVAGLAGLRLLAG